MQIAGGIDFAVVQASDSMAASAFSSGVPHGSILALADYYAYFFYKDLPLVLSKNVSAPDLYGDDTTIYDIQSDLKTLWSNLQEPLLILQRWCRENGMLLN